MKWSIVDRFFLKRQLLLIFFSLFLFYVSLEDNLFISDLNKFSHSSGSRTNMKDIANDDVFFYIFLVQSYIVNRQGMSTLNHTQRVQRKDTKKFFFGTPTTLDLDKRKQCYRYVLEIVTSMVMIVTWDYGKK